MSGKRIGGVVQIIRKRKHVVSLIVWSKIWTWVHGGWRQWNVNYWSFSTAQWSTVEADRDSFRLHLRHDSTTELLTAEIRKDTKSLCKLYGLVILCWVQNHLSYEWPISSSSQDCRAVLSDKPLGERPMYCTYLHSSQITAKLVCCNNEYFNRKQFKLLVQIWSRCAHVSNVIRFYLKLTKRPHCVSSYLPVGL